MLTDDAAGQSLVRLVADVPGCKVVADPAELDAANTATFRTSQRSQLIVQAESADGVADLMRTARQHALRVSAVSRGKNWGFGSKVPARSGEILLELSRLDRITAYDAAYGTVRVEAGVTFRQLADFLVSEGNHHFHSVIGGSPDASVVGNLLERGDGTGPLWDRSIHCCSPHIVLADGSTHDLGFGGVPGSQLAALSRHAPGPDLAALLPQSGLAIVTALTLWLHPVPTEFRTFAFKLPTSDRLGSVLTVLRDLYRRAVLTSPITFWNDYKQAASGGFRPAQVGGSLPLSRAQLAALSDDHNVWTGFGGLYHDHARMTRVVHRELRRALRPHVRRAGPFDHLSTRRVGLLRKIARIVPQHRMDFSTLLDEWDHNPLLGAPSAAGLRGLHWRKSTGPGAAVDPYDDQLGVLWNAFEAPFDPDALPRVFAKLEERILGHGFEPIISFTAADARVVRVFQQLVFDRADPAQDAAALRCHRDVFDHLEACGLNHGRADCSTMDVLADAQSQTKLNKRLKSALDPDDLLFPGRYGV